MVLVHGSGTKTVAQAGRAGGYVGQPHNCGLGDIQSVVSLDLIGKLCYIFINLATNWMLTAWIPMHGESA